MIELRYLHSALSLMTLYKCIKFRHIPSVLSEICSGQSFYCKKLKVVINSLNTDRVMVLAFRNFADGLLSMYQVSFNFPL